MQCCCRVSVFWWTHLQRWEVISLPSWGSNSENDADAIGQMNAAWLGLRKGCRRPCKGIPVTWPEAQHACWHCLQQYAQSWKQATAPGFHVHVLPVNDRNRSIRSCGTSVLLGSDRYSILAFQGAGKNDTPPPLPHHGKSLNPRKLPTLHLYVVSADDAADFSADNC